MLNAEQKQALQAIAIWEPQSFPNRSDYRIQKLPDGKRNGITVAVKYNRGYDVTFPDGSKAMVNFDRVPIGPGTDLGEDFCTRDQALVALQ